MVFPSGHAMELDVFAPDLYLAIEYHGVQHYKDLHPFGEQKTIAQRDKQKREACERV